MARLEEASAQNEKRLDEKLHEVAQFSNQLETLREESARQIARCKDRSETVKRSLQNQIADLERQLAQARATARTAQKDKDEVRFIYMYYIDNKKQSQKLSFKGNLSTCIGSKTKFHLNDISLLNSRFGKGCSRRLTI